MKNILFFIICFLSFETYSQQWDWANQATLTTGKQTSKDVYSDKTGNVYMIGYNDTTAYYGSTMLDSGSFVVKYSSSGNLLWAKKIAGSVQGLVTDAAGNLFLVGNFSGGITIGSFNLISNGGSDIYLTKIHSSGTVFWAKSYGGTMSDAGIAMEIDNAGNMYITGIFRDSISFDGNNLKVLASNNWGGQLFYLVKINSLGIADWAKTCPYNYSGNPYQYHAPKFLCLDKEGSIYITGQYTFFPCDEYCTRYFILKYDSSGTLKMDQRPWLFFDYPFGLAVDDSLNILVEYNCGSHYTDCRVLNKYDSSMNLKWQKYLGSYGYWDNYSFVYGLSVDSLSNIYVAGYFGGSDFSGNDSIHLCSQWIVGKGETDILVGKFDSSGNCIWLETAGGTGYENLPYSQQQAMHVDRTGNCYLTGNYSVNPSSGIVNDTVAFDNDTLRNDGNWQQIYLAKINTTTPIIATTNGSAPSEIFEFQIFPNPTNGQFTLQVNENMKQQVQNSDMIFVFDQSGNCVLRQQFSNSSTQQIDISKMAKGIYFVEVEKEGARINKKIILN